MGLFVTSAPERADRSDGDRMSWWASLCLLCAILGALLGISFKAQHQIRTSYLPSNNYEGLAVEYLHMKDRDQGNEKTISNLRREVSKLESAETPNNDKLRIISQDLAQANFLAGLTDVTGPGVIVILNDSKKTVQNLPSEIANPSLIHDTDINAVVNELKAAGAEAVAINSERVVGITAIRCAGPTVLVNDVPQTPPYLIRAIGVPETLDKALKLPNGVFDAISQMDPAMISVQTAKKLVLPAYSGPTQPRVAKTVLVGGH